MLRGRTTVVAVLLAVGALVAPGCSWADADEGGLLVVGDSVTQMSTAAIEAELAWADLDVRAFPGLRTDELVELATEGAAGEPDIAVVLTGYNDLYQDNVEDGALADMVETLDDVPCVVWILLPDIGDWPAERSRRWNDRIRDEVADHDAMHVSVEWAALVDAAPPGTLVQDDLVHPTPQGSEALAAVMERAVETDCTV